MSIRRLVSILVALAYLCGSSLRAETPAAEPAIPAKKQFHLYLLIGQSNMAGRGPVDDEGRVSHPRTLKFTKENTWAPATEPLHFDIPRIVGAGLGLTFARAMADADPGVTIGLIPCAVGGTPLERWQKGGDLWQQAVARAKAAMKVGTLKGVLWHQGESDSGTKANAESYAARLAEMIKDLRTELDAPDVPFVAGELGEFLSERKKGRVPPYWRLVNEQLSELPKLVPRTAIVKSAGLQHKGDFVHFGTPSLRLFGRRYAKAMQKLQE
jgi:hypothetical protein